MKPLTSNHLSINPSIHSSISSARYPLDPKPLCLRPPSILARDLPLQSAAPSRHAAGESLAEMEKRHIAAVLERTKGNITRAAEILQVDRGTVYNKLKEYGLRH